MRTASLLPALSLVALAAGCGPGRTLFQGGSAPTVGPQDIHLLKFGVGPAEPSADTYMIAANRTAGANPFVSYRIQWRNAPFAREQRRFTGSVWSLGRFTERDPGCVDGTCPLESGDFVSTIHRVGSALRMDWDAFAGDEVDGLDFVVDTEPVLFDFFIDGVPLPQNVVFVDGTTGQDATAAAMPFGLTTQ